MNISTADPSQRKLEFVPSLARKPNPAAKTAASTASSFGVERQSGIQSGMALTSGAASPAALAEAGVGARSAPKPLSQGTLSEWVDVSQPEDLPRHRPGFPVTTTPTMRGGYTPPRQFGNLNGGPVVAKSSSGERMVTHPPSSRSALNFALRETPRDRPPAGPTGGREKGTKQAVVLTAEQQVYRHCAPVCPCFTYLVYPHPRCVEFAFLCATGRYKVRPGGDGQPYCCMRQFSS